MWSTCIVAETESYIQFEIIKDDEVITCSEFVDGLAFSTEFRIFYNSVLKNFSYQSYFWENPPIQFSSLKSKYECMVINGPELLNLRTDKSPFERNFIKSKSVVAFTNLGKDATLIVPCPDGEITAYTHLANFVRSGLEVQVDDFWKTIGVTLKSLIGNDSKWLSTSGLGVSWLHARIDSNPKYYKTKNYKDLS